MVDFIAAGIGLALGSIVWGVVLSRLYFRRDLREQDNPGGSGAVRRFGWRFGVLVAFLDLAKGYLAVVAAGALGAGELGLAAAAAAVVAGHNWPIWLGFRGGGGLATATGALLALGPAQTAAALAIALAAAAAYKLAGMPGRLPMASLPFGSLFGLPATVVFYARAGNQAGIWAAAAITVLIGLRGLQMLNEWRRRRGRRPPPKKGSSEGNDRSRLPSNVPP